MIIILLYQGVEMILVLYIPQQVERSPRKRPWGCNSEHFGSSISFDTFVMHLEWNNERDTES